ncbi:unnamed protein product [Caenorhabditis auriculariae]|uniref:Uncharacterized protein n=1 Tax=Caenorhabditis auriculariae TaxID=2777116 RepID=A0A8S1HI86_9PELO|nr:unnamed protein product [Caenorhabditis auriculariae]
MTSNQQKTVKSGEDIQLPFHILPTTTAVTRMKNGKKEFYHLAERLNMDKMVYWVGERGQAKPGGARIDVNDGVAVLRDVHENDSGDYNVIPFEEEPLKVVVE